MDRLLQNAKITSALILALTVFAGSSAIAEGTPAGTIINCWSTANYANGQGVPQPPVVSNVVSVTVAQKAGVSVSPPSTTLSSPAGQTVVFPAEIHNTGNGTDSVSVTSSAASGWTTTMYVDDNGDGIKEQNETTVVPASMSLPPDSVLKLLVCVQIPQTTKANTSTSISLRAQSSVDTTVIAQASYGLTATAFVPTVILASNPAAPLLGQPFTVTVQTNPARQTQVQVSMVGPDGSVTNSTVPTDASGAGSITQTASISGPWLLTALAPADSQNVAATGTLTLTCQGPTFQVDGLDMISIPLQMTSPAAASLYNTQNPIAMARWLPDQQRYAVFDPLNGVTNDPELQNVTVGDAYWIVSAVPTTLAPEGKLVDQTLPFTISLPAGWSQIGSPFITSTNWSDTKVVYNGQTLSLSDARAQGIMLDYAWTLLKLNGIYGYALVHATLPGALTTLDPWRGYWVYLAQPAQVVIAPPPAASSTNVVAGGSATRSSSSQNASRGESAAPSRLYRPNPAAQWIVTLSSSNPYTVDKSNYFGVSSDTSLYGMINAPRAADYEDLYFPTSNTATGSGPFASDIRSAINGLTTWDFEVASSDTSDVHILSWDGVNAVPSGYAVMLKDLQTNTMIDMRSMSSYTFRISSEDSPAKFQIDVAPNSGTWR